MTRFQQGIIIGWFIGSIIDFILKEFDYYGIFEASIFCIYYIYGLIVFIPKKIYKWYLDTIIGWWLSYFKLLVLIDGKLIKLNLEDDELEEVLKSLNYRKEDTIKKKTKLTWIKRLTLKNIDDIILTVENFKEDTGNEHISLKERLSEYDSENTEDEIRPPSLDGLMDAVREMQDVRFGRKEKVFVERIER